MAKVVIYLFYLRVIFMHGGHQQCVAQVLFNVRLVAFCWESIWLLAPSDGHVPPGLILSWGDSYSVTDQSDRVKGPAASAQQRVPRGSPAEAAVAPAVRLDFLLCLFPLPSFSVDLTGIVPKSCLNKCLAGYTLVSEPASLEPACSGFMPGQEIKS